MGIRTTIPPGATPLAAVDAIMAMYGRENIELAIEVLIERLDRLDGDPDIEAMADDDYCGAFEDYGTTGPQSSHGTDRRLIGDCEDDEDDDPAGGNIDDEGDGERVHYAPPAYDLDQTTGPSNYEALERAADVASLERAARADAMIMAARRHWGGQ